MQKRLADGIAAFACVNTSNRLVYAGIGCGAVLQVQTFAYIPLQAIFTPPCKLLVVGRLQYHQGSALLPQQGLFVIAIYLGAEGYVFRLVVKIEILDEFPVLAIAELGAGLGKGCKQSRIARCVGIGESPSVLVFVEVG